MKAGALPATDEAKVDETADRDVQYFADPFPAAPWRAALAEPIPDQADSAR